jgi:hypothetical protein
MFVCSSSLSYRQGLLATRDEFSNAWQHCSSRDPLIEENSESTCGYLVVVRRPAVENCDCGENEGIVHVAEFKEPLRHGCARSGDAFVGSDSTCLSLLPDNRSADRGQQKTSSLFEMLINAPEFGNELARGVQDNRRQRLPTERAQRRKAKFRVAFLAYNAFSTHGYRPGTVRER